MPMLVRNVVHKSVYHDSVTLMRLTRDLQVIDGVRRAAVMMGTPSNRALLRDAGLLTPDGDAASPNDLIIAVEAADIAVAHAGTQAGEAALSASRSSTLTRQTTYRPRRLRSALTMLDGANLVLISVPGLYAGLEAMKALQAGIHVMLFSDNVPVTTEIELKRFALARGLLMLGPDCGTAIINGVPLGFANAVPRGRVGLAAASGTGLQEVSCLIAAAGEGISQAIGVGGRDLTDDVGGLMMAHALEILAADPVTEVIVVLGKPPGPAHLGAFTNPTRTATEAMRRTSFGVDLCRRHVLACRSHPRRGSSGCSRTRPRRADNADRIHHAHGRDRAVHRGRNARHATRPALCARPLCGGNIGLRGAWPATSQVTSGVSRYTGRRGGTLRRRSG